MDLKIELQRLPKPEHSVEQSARSMARTMKTMEATEKAVPALALPKAVY